MTIRINWTKKDGMPVKIEAKTLTQASRDLIDIIILDEDGDAISSGLFVDAVATAEEMK